MAIIDWYSRTNSRRFRRDTVLAVVEHHGRGIFCVDCLEEAIKAYGTPEIFNSDQGLQFTSDAFTRVLIKNDITISIPSGAQVDGRGRALDNIFVERLWRGQI